MAPVPELALRDLVSAAARCVPEPLSPDPFDLLDMEVCVETARRFKVDVSFALRVDASASARFSVNDKGEPEAFRRRLLDHADALAIDRALLERFFAISPPGEAQTTVGVKWSDSGGAPERVSLYYEELPHAPRAANIMRHVAALAGTPLPEPLAPARAGAICIDIQNSDIVALKDYWMVLERSDTPAIQLPPAAEQHRRAFPLDPKRGTRRYLLARRIPNGGSKLLWMSESHEASAANRAWDLVDKIRQSMSIPTSLPAQTLDGLRAEWSHDGLFLYPDLVSLDCDADGEVAALVLYVSLK
jgi:hypothetical protein